MADIQAIEAAIREVQIRIDVETEVVRLREAHIRGFANPRTDPGGDKAWEQARLGETKRLTNLVERHAVLELARTFPERRFLLQVEVIGFVDKDGKAHWLKEGQVRIADAGEVDAERLRRIEFKTAATIKRSASKGPGLVGRFTGELAGQLGKENAKRLRNAAWIVYRGIDPVTEAHGEFQAREVSGSTVTEYRRIVDRMLEVKPRPRDGGPSPRPGVNDPKGIAGRGVGGENRGVVESRPPLAFVQKGNAAMQSWLTSKAEARSAHTGVAIYFHQKLLALLKETVLARVKSAMHARMAEIELARGAGKYVVVEFTVMQPEKPDFFGHNAIPLYHGIAIRTGGTLEELRQPSMSAAPAAGRGPRAEVPKGWVLVAYEYAVFEPRAEAGVQARASSWEVRAVRTDWYADKEEENAFRRHAYARVFSIDWTDGARKVSIGDAQNGEQWQVYRVEWSVATQSIRVVAEKKSAAYSMDSTLHFVGPRTVYEKVTVRGAMGVRALGEIEWEILGRR